MTEPEIASPPVKYATFNTRVLASSIDIFIFITFAIPVTNWLLDILFGPLDTDAISAILRQTDVLQDPHKLMPALWHQVNAQHLILRSAAENIIQLILFAAYTFPFWMHYAATPGKMLFRMEIHDTRTNARITRNQAIARFFGYLLSFIPLTLGFIWIIFNKKRQAWHDMLAHTVVIIRPKEAHLPEK